MPQIISGTYAALSGTKFNATTSAINFGATPRTSAAQTSIALVRPTAAGENDLGWIWGRANGTGSGHRLYINSNASGFAGTPCLGFAASTSTGANGTPVKVSNATGGELSYGDWWHLAATWGGGTAATEITLYGGKNGALLAALPFFSVTSGSGVGTDSSANSFLIGNSTTGDRTFNGSIAYVAKWDRVLSLVQLRTVQKYGPLVIPVGLTICWANDRDYSLYRCHPTSKTALASGIAPSGQRILIPLRKMWANGSVAAASSSSNRWFLVS